jgi:DNA polymerase-3 subunit alpha
MKIANIMASYSMSEADLLRKAMSKKKEDILIKEKENFISRSIKNGYTEETSTKVYDLIFKFASYGFNRAHSVAYAITAYKMAYLKANYPLIFSVNLLTMYQGSEDKTKEYISECKQNKINFLVPDINYSSYNYKIENNSIRYPLSIIKGIGRNIIIAIEEARDNKYFVDIYDFFSRIYKKGIGKKRLKL